MTRLRKPVTLRNPETGRALTLTMLVDTGSLLTIVPRDRAEQLGLPVLGHREFEQVDRSLVSYEISHVDITVQGYTAGVTCAFGDEVAEPILGITALEQLMLAVDPVNEESVPIRGRLGGSARPL